MKHFPLKSRFVRKCAWSPFKIFSIDFSHYKRRFSYLEILTDIILYNTICIVPIKIEIFLKISIFHPLKFTPVTTHHSIKRECLMTDEST